MGGLRNEQGSIRDTLEIEIIQNPPRICNILLIFPLCFFLIFPALRLMNRLPVKHCMAVPDSVPRPLVDNTLPPASPSASHSTRVLLCLLTSRVPTQEAVQMAKLSQVERGKKRKKKHITVTHFVLDQRGLLASLSWCVQKALDMEHLRSFSCLTSP